MIKKKTHFMLMAGIFVFLVGGLLLSGKSAAPAYAECGPWNKVFDSNGNLIGWTCVCNDGGPTYCLCCDGFDSNGTPVNKRQCPC